jgi:Protein of unknown function DUF262
MSPKHLVKAAQSAAPSAVEHQIRQIQRDIRFDTRDFPVETIVSRFGQENFFIPPYQREFIWNEGDQSYFIESVLMGLPIPIMFLAETSDGTFEIVDGAQRIRTLASFMDNDLKLSDMKKLTTLNGFTFAQLPETQRNKFSSRALRLVILDQETSDENRKELFDRINKSGKSLTPSERRRGALAGRFMKFLEGCAKKPLFLELCPVSAAMKKRKEPLELITRFFAYSERYKHFVHDVDAFLDQFVRDNRTDFDKVRFQKEFNEMLKFVKKYFPYGFAKTATATTTPRVRFEALSVGINLALREKPELVPESVITWLESEEFIKQTTTHASNSPVRMSGRINFVHDHVLGIVQ